MIHHHFDTLDVAKSFIASGMKVELAETVAKAIAVSRDADFSNLATKADIAEVKSATKADIAAVKADIGAVKAELLVKIADSKHELLKWMIGMNIATVSILMAFFKLFI